MQYTTPLRLTTNAWLFTCENIKSEPCRHCSSTGHLKSHGKLEGTCVDKPGKVTRGLRFFCSNRYSNKGCGRTFSVLFGTFISGHTLDTENLFRLIKRLLAAPNPHAAWQASGIPFSLRSVYRWVRKLTLNQPTIRHMLYCHTRPPGTTGRTPLHTSLNFLLLAFTGKNNPVSCFQLRHDTGIFYQPTT